MLASIRGSIDDHVKHLVIQPHRLHLTSRSRVRFATFRFVGLCPHFHETVSGVSSLSCHFPTISSRIHLASSSPRTTLLVT